MSVQNKRTGANKHEYEPKNLFLQQMLKAKRLYWQCFPLILGLSASLTLKTVPLFCTNMIIGTKIA
jgi:hypothetical protein